MPEGRYKLCGCLLILKVKTYVWMGMKLFIKILAVRTATNLGETKITPQNIKISYKCHSKYKKRHGSMEPYSFSKSIFVDCNL